MLTKATKNLICKIKIFYLYMKSLALLFVNLLTKDGTPVWKQRLHIEL